jgi:hypothetical protein
MNNLKDTLSPKLMLALGHPSAIRRHEFVGLLIRAGSAGEARYASAR